jgi:hypothetical protein
VAAEEWADRGTVRAVRGRDSEWAVAGVREVGELVVPGELEDLAVRGAAGLAAPACGILARPAEEVAAKALARVGPVGEVVPEAGLAVAELEELGAVAREAEELAGLAGLVQAVQGLAQVELERVGLVAGELRPLVARLLLQENG